MKLNKLPDDLITNMNRSVSIDTNNFERPLEAILNERLKRPTVENNTPPVPTAPKVPMVAIDNFILPADELTLFMYLISTVFSENPKVKKILDTFQFTMKDVNGNVIYPKKKRGKRG